MGELQAAEAAYAELAKITLADRSLTDVLRTVADLAARVVPGAEEVSLTLIERGTPRTVVFQGERAPVLDERQYEAGYGPCLDAAVTSRVILVPDTATDQLYPEFSATAARHGIGAVISVGLTAESASTGALNVYASDQSVFTEEARDALLRFASFAAVAVANAAVYTGALLEVEQLKEAMTSRAVIEQAKGMIMLTHGCDAEEAFRVLREHSMRHNRKLRDVASAFVEQARSAAARS